MFFSSPIDLANFKSKTFNPNDAAHVAFVNEQMTTFKATKNKLLGLDKLVLAIGGGANTFFWAVGIFGFYGVVIHPAIFIGIAHYYFRNDIRKEFAKEFYQQLNIMKEVAVWCGDKSDVGKDANELVSSFNAPVPESWSAILFSTKKQIEAKLYNDNSRAAEPMNYSLWQTLRQMFG